MNGVYRPIFNNIMRTGLAVMLLVAMLGVSASSTAAVPPVSVDLDKIGITKPEIKLDEPLLADTFTAASIKRIYEKVKPALVVINYTIETYDRSTQRTRKQRGYALGVIVRPDGLIMAPGHVFLPDAKPFDVRVTLTSRKEYEAHVLPKDKRINVAFFRIDSSETLELPHVEFTQKDLDIGEPVMVVGMLTRSLDFARAFVMGRVNSIIEQPRKVYTLSAPISYGIMSAPVIDARGDVVGVMGRDLAPSEGGEIYVRYDHPVVYPTSEFAALIKNPPSETEKPSNDDAWLGVFTQPLSDDMAAYWRIEPTGGIVVSGVLPRSPAEKSGIERGDIIKALNGTPVTVRYEAQLPEFTKMVRDVGPHNTVTLSLLRKGQPIEVKVKLVESPKDRNEAERYENDLFGITVRELTVDVILYNELDPDIEGVVVHSVVSAGWAALAGLRPDDIIRKVGNEPITSIDDMKRVLDKLKSEKPKEIVIFAQRGSRTAFFRMEPQWDTVNK